MEQVLYVWIGSLLVNPPSNLNQLNLNKYLITKSISIELHEHKIDHLLSLYGGTKLSLELNTNNQTVFRFLDFKQYGFKNKEEFECESRAVRKSNDFNNGTFARSDNTFDFIFINTPEVSYIKTLNVELSETTKKVFNHLNP